MATVLLTVSTTVAPATDLGYLLVKHPDRVHSFDVPTGTAYVCFPQATQARCTAALILDVDPLRLAAGGRRGRRTGQSTMPEGFTLGQYVNDRSYAASSLLAAAMARAFRSALRGDSRDRPDLAATPIPLEIGIPVLRCRGGADLAERLFAPLGWRVAATPIPLDELHPNWGDSRYVDLTLTGTLRLADALNHLYVLLPVIDDAKHYWVAPDEIDKLLRAGEGWLGGHPEHALITRRFLAHRRALAGEALTRLAAARLTEADDGLDPDSVEADERAAAADEEEAEMPETVRRVPLAAHAGAPCSPRSRSPAPPAWSTWAAAAARCSSSSRRTGATAGLRAAAVVGEGRRADPGAVRQRGGRRPGRAAAGAGRAGRRRGSTPRRG